MLRVGLAAALTMVGCFDLDAAVFVDASLAEPSIAVQDSGLVTGVGGGFRLDLHLGPRAEAESTVSLGSVSVTNADRTTTVIDAFQAAPAPAFPVVVGIDSDVSVTFTAEATDNQLEAAAIDEICGAGDLVYVVLIDDSLRGGSVTAASEAVAPSGCP